MEAEREGKQREERARTERERAEAGRGRAEAREGEGGAAQLEAHAAELAEARAAQRQHLQLCEQLEREQLEQATLLEAARAALGALEARRETQVASGRVAVFDS